MARLQAPPGKFRVVGVDTFANEDFVIDDFSERATALEVAQKKGGQMFKTYVYDDMGKNIGEGGTF